MMGYRDPNDVDEEQEAAYWDMVLHDFGVREYFTQRYERAAQSKETVMEFTVSFTGTKTLDIGTDDLIDAAESELQNIAGQIDGLEVSAVDGTVEVEFEVSGSITIEISDDDVRDLVGDKAERELGLDSFDLQEVESR